jgi:ribosome maturation factor RimP
VATRLGDRPVTGRIVEADDARVVLETDGGRIETPYAELGPGSVQVEFSRRDPDDGADEDEAGLDAGEGVES